MTTEFSPEAQAYWDGREAFSEGKERSEEGLLPELKKHWLAGYDDAKKEGTKIESLDALNQAIIEHEA